MVRVVGENYDRGCLVHGVEENRSRERCEDVSVGHRAAPCSGFLDLGAAADSRPERGFFPGFELCEDNGNRSMLDRTWSVASSYYNCARGGSRSCIPFPGIGKDRDAGARARAIGEHASEEA